MEAVTKQRKTVLEAKRIGVLHCGPQASLLQVAKLMVDKVVSAVVVVDADEDLVGIISRTDMLRARLERDDWARRPVAEHMSRDVVTVTTDTRLHEVTELLVEERIHRVVVVDQEEGRRRPLMVLSDTDLLYHMLKEG